LFIIVPLIIIFLAFAYLELNENISLIEEIIVYSIVVGVVFISIRLYNKVKNDVKLQEINALRFEYNELMNKYKQSKDEEYKKNLTIKIEKIKKEIDEKLL
jgi:beta-lactamase regulating signal transducer with metallopeptidase domain